MTPCGWEGNRRSGVTLAMRHRLEWFIHLRAHGLDREMSTPLMLSCGVLTHLTWVALSGSTFPETFRALNPKLSEWKRNQFRTQCKTNVESCLHWF